MVEINRSLSIQLNGEPCSFVMDDWTLNSLFFSLNLDKKGRIVEVNGTIIDERHYDRCIYPNDVIEIIQFMGGGDHT